MRKILMVQLAAFGLMATQAFAQITLENSGAISSAPTSTGPETLTLPDFDTSEANYLVASTMGKVQNSGDLFTSLTYDGNPMTLLASHWVNSSYDIYIRIYGIEVSGGSGDVVFSYTDSAGGSAHDSVGLTVAAYSGVDTASPGGAVTAGADSPSSTTSLTDSITTTADDSLIISTFSMADGAAFTGGTSTKIVDSADGGNKARVGLFSLAAPGAGAYSPNATWGSGSFRSVTVGVELLGDTEPKATIFMVY